MPYEAVAHFGGDGAGGCLMVDVPTVLDWALVLGPLVS
jgi:hypothetical protein